MTVIKRWWSERKIIVIGAIVIIAILLVALLTYYLRVVRGLVWADWTGIEEKKLWDALELLIVPAFLGLVAYLFNRFQNEREQLRADLRALIERELAIDRQQEEALQKYLKSNKLI